MRRNNITATAMHLTSSKMRDFASKINAGNMGILGKINLPSYILH